MTELYDWNPMPHVVSVKCPNCGSEADFEFAELVRIKTKADVPYFEKSNVFEYHRLLSSSGYWHAVIYFHGLRSVSLTELTDLPDGYSPEDWDHSQYLYRSHGSDIGSVVCIACSLRKKHVLDWPNDAFFQIDYKGKQLWAFNRETAEILQRFVSSTTRSQRGPWSGFLRKVPKEFLSAKARDPIVKKLDQLLK